ATVAYIATRSPTSDPAARYANAEKLKRDPMMKNHTPHYKPWAAIHDSNPVQILKRHEPVGADRMLTSDGALADHLLPAAPAKSVAAYKAAGGDVQYEVFEGSEHEWVATPGPQTDRAREMVKAFIARQLRK